MHGFVVIGTNADPHVTGVCRELESLGVPTRIVDYKDGTSVNVSMDKFGSWEFDVNNEPISPPFLLWDRLKIRTAPPLTIDDEPRSADYRSKEWMAFYRLLTSVYDEYTVNSRRSRLCILKPYQQLIAARVGMFVPPTLLTNERDRAIRFAEQQQSLIVKSLSTGTVQPKPEESGAPYVMRTMPVAIEDLQRATDQELNDCPHFFQKDIEKDYELRVVGVDDSYFAFKIHSQKKELTKVDWRTGIRSVEFEPIELSESLREQLFSYFSETGLFTGSFDLIVDKAGDTWFLECNQDGQWGWLDELIDGAITRAFAKAFKTKLEHIRESSTSSGTYAA